MANSTSAQYLLVLSVLIRVILTVSLFSPPLGILSFVSQLCFFVYVIYLGYSKHDLLDYIKDIFLGLFVTLNATYGEACTENTKVLENLVIY